MPSNYKLDELISYLDKFYPLVEYAHRNFEVIPQSVPNDSLYNRQTSLFDPAGFADINVEQAWQIETGKKFIKVGVHDNGIDSLHPDLDILTGGDYFPNNQNPGWGTEIAAPHGTPIAGIIGAKRNNNIGISGIAGGDGSDTTGCSLIDFKSPFFTPAHLSYRLASTVDAARSAGTYFEYGDNYFFEGENDFYFNSAKGFGVHIGNHSYAVRTVIPLSDQDKTTSTDSSSVIDYPNCGLCRETFLFSLQNGVINVVARGNRSSLHFANSPPTYVEGLFPQSLPDGWIISVGASGYDGNTIEEGINQSSSEQTFYSLYGGNMDLVAPGSDSIVFSTVPTHISSIYRKFNGTSAAAPHVAGAAALLLSHYNRPCYSNQNLTIEDVEYLLEKSATDIFTPGFDEKSGAGRLNVGAAINMIGDPTKQIIHPDSLVSSVIVQRDTIALAYNKTFVADGWGPISQSIPLEQGRAYKVERVFVENTYSFHDYFTSTTTLIDSWACPSISNSVEFYRDTIKQQMQNGTSPTTSEHSVFRLFKRDPFDSIVSIDTNNREMIVGGYFYKFLIPYLDIFTLNISQGSNTGNTPGDIIEEIDPTLAINQWYPFNPETEIPRMVASLYISDPNLSEQYTFVCDSTNLLYDDTTITDHTSTDEFDLNSSTVKLYPNPGSKAFTITFSNPETVNQITVYSTEGKKITQIPTNRGTLNVNVSSWANGVYYIKVNGDSFSTTLKYLKQ